MAEVAFVVGLVASVIGIIDGTKQVWDAVKDAKGQLEAFRQVAARLPLVLSILNKAKSELLKLNSAAQEELERPLEECKEKAEKLHKIFRKVLPRNDDGWLEKYRKAMNALVKGGRVEELMEGILTDVQVIAADKLMRTATEEQVRELADAIKEMKEMPSSLPDETAPVTQTHSGSGHNIANTGPGNTNNIQSGGSGSFYHNSGPAYFGDSSTTNNYYQGNQNQPEWKSTSGNVHFLTPRQVNPFFTGQRKILEEMQTKLCSVAGASQEPSQNRFVIIGIGGAGKSELCLKFADSHRQEFWGVFWIDASTTTTIERGYLNAARLCGAVENYELAKAFLDSMRHPCLFILDNADDLELDLNPYLPAGSKATTLITSRNDQIASSYSSAGAKTLEELDMDDAIELLLKASSTPVASWADKHGDAKAVAQLLAKHTLAVIQAGAYIKQRRCTLKEYHTKFLRQREDLLRFRNRQARSTYGDVYATFEVSAQFLERSKSVDRSYANALQLLGVLAHLYFTGVPEAMFTRAWEYGKSIPGAAPQDDDIECFSRWHVSNLPNMLQESSSDNGVDDIIDSLQEALGVLRSFAIITIDLVTRDVSMHPLAYAWARDRLNEPGKQGAWACSASLIALSTEGDNVYEDFWRALQPHIESCMDTSPKELFKLYPAIEIGRMVYEFALILFGVGDYFRAKALIGTLCKEFDPNICGVLSGHLIQYLHAICLSRNEEFGPAQTLLEEIVHSDKGTTMIKDKTRWLAKVELAYIYTANGEYQVSVGILREVAQIQKSTLNPAHPDCLALQHGLASALLADRKYQEAISIFREVVQIQEATLNPTHPDRLASQHDLAAALLEDGKIPEAISLLREVVKIQSTLKPEHFDRLTSQHELARALLADGQIQEAISLFREVVQIQEATFNPTQPFLLISKLRLAFCLRKIEENREALEIIQVVVPAAQGIWKSSDGRREECEQLLQACLASMEEPAVVTTALPITEDDKGGSGVGIKGGRGRRQGKEDGGEGDVDEDNNGEDEEWEDEDQEYEDREDGDQEDYLCRKSLDMHVDSRTELRKEKGV